MSEPQTTEKPLSPIQEATQRWEKAEMAVTALEAKGEKPTPAPTPEPPPDPEKTPTDPAPPEPSEPEAAKADEKKPEGNPKVAELHALAKELGLKVDARGVTTEERYGHRQEKRKYQETVKQREAEFQKRLEQTNAYFAPLHPAVEALKQGDYDGAVRALAKAVNDEEVAREGLNGATKRYLKRAAGEDPRIDELRRWKEQKEAEESQRTQWEAEQRQAVEYRQHRQAFTQEKAVELSKSDDAFVARLAAKPAFAEQVVACMERNWDGYETISAEEAAQQVAKELRSAYDELREVFGAPDPSTRENPGASQEAGRTGKASVGKKAPKALNARSAAEASPPGKASTDPRVWRETWADKLRQATE